MTQQCLEIYAEKAPPLLRSVGKYQKRPWDCDKNGNNVAARTKDSLCRLCHCIVAKLLHVSQPLPCSVSVPSILEYSESPSNRRYLLYCTLRYWCTRECMYGTQQYWVITLLYDGHPTKDDISEISLSQFSISQVVNTKKREKIDSKRPRLFVMLKKIREFL